MTAPIPTTCAKMDIMTPMKSALRSSFRTSSRIDPVSSAIVSAINQLAHAMGLKTVAEFVDSNAIKKLLKGLGVDYAQGYGIAKPLPLADQLQTLAKTAKKPVRKAAQAQPA